MRCHSVNQISIILCSRHRFHTRQHLSITCHQMQHVSPIPRNRKTYAKFNRFSYSAAHLFQPKVFYHCVPESWRWFPLNQALSNEHCSSTLIHPPKVIESSTPKQLNLNMSISVCSEVHIFLTDKAHKLNMKKRKHDFQATGTTIWKILLITPVRPRKEFILLVICPYAQSIHSSAVPGDAHTLISGFRNQHRHRQKLLRLRKKRK